MKKHFLFVLPIVLGLCACAKAPEEQHTSYQTMNVTYESVTENVSFSATLEGLNDAVISPRVNGHLTKKCVEEGQHVRPGDVLFMIDNREALLQVNSNNADVSAAEAQLSTAKLEYQSQQNLYNKGITSSFLLEEAKNRVQTAEAALQQAQARLNTAKLNLEYHTIKAPIAGIVGAIPYNVGELIDVNSVLTTISGTQDMIAKFSINENALNNLILAGGVDLLLQTVPEVSLQLKDGSDYSHNGHIISISGIVNRITGAVSVRAKFPNPEGQLYSGIQGTVNIPFTYDSVMVIPQTAVVHLQNKAIVYKVKDDGTALATNIEMEALGDGKQVAVLNGLNINDKIVAVGAANVSDGQQVIF